MIIYKIFFWTFPILMLQFPCSSFSEDEKETALESIYENLALYTNSTHPESVKPDKFQTVYKRCLRNKLGFLKDTKNSKETLKLEYSDFAQRLNPTFSKLDLSKDENKPKYGEKSDSVTTDENGGTTTNIRHQSRGWKDYKTKTNGRHEIFSTENEETDSSDNDHESLKSIDENFALDTKATYPVSIKPDVYQNLYTRCLVTKPAFKKDTKNSKETSEPEYSDLAQRPYPTFSKWNLSKHENKPNYGEKSDSVTTEGNGVSTMNIKHQSRNWKDYKTKSNGRPETFSGENDETDSSNNERENLEPIDENFALDTKSAYPESVKPDKYQRLYYRCLKTKFDFQRDTKNSKENSEPEYFDLAQRLYHTFFKGDLFKVDDKPNYGKISDPATTKENRITTKIKYQSRGWKDCKTKNNCRYEIFSIKNEGTDSSDNKHENMLSKLDLVIGLNKFEKLELEKDFGNFIKKVNKNERSQEQIFKILETNNGKLPDPVIPMGEDGFLVLIGLGINAFHLEKPVNPQIVQSLHIIYKELISLIGVDIQSNIFPLVFYQTVSPIIKEKLLPFLEVPILKEKVAIFDKDYKFPVLFIILRDLIEISEDLKKDDYTISNFFRAIDNAFKERLINVNEGNKILVNLYKKNVERIQELLYEDWKENEAPVNFIKYISNYFRREKYLVIGRIFNQMMIKKLERSDILKVKGIKLFSEIFRTFQGRMNYEDEDFNCYRRSGLGSTESKKTN